MAFEKNSKETEVQDEKLAAEKEALLNEIKQTYGIEVPKEEAEEVVDDAVETAKEPAEETVTDTIADEDLESSYNETISITAKEPLPKYGKCFAFVPIACGTTLLAVILGHIPPINMGIPSNSTIRYIYIGFGCLLAVLALLLIVNAIAEAHIYENIQMGKLVTTGVYSKTRNPIYAGVIFGCTGILFISGNAFMYVLPIIYWFLLTYMLINTEEVILRRRFGQDYKEYMQKTNRIAPIPKREE
jgi:protein-S-isoprenylcysteine O-methyltransferase Ste14